MSDGFRSAFSNAVKRAEERQWVYGLLGRKNQDGTYTFDVPGRRGFVYVTLRQSNGAQTVVPARNDEGVPQQANLGVRMKLEYGVYVIRGKANRADLVNAPATPAYGIPAHATSHKDGGADEIATLTPAPFAIPKADASGFLDDWISVAGYSQEEIEDFVAAQFIGNTGVIDATYNDTTGAITLTLDVSAADRYLYSTGADTWAEGTITSFARGLLDDTDAATMRSTLGLVIGTNVQAYDAELAAIAGLTSAADRLPYFTGSGTAALATFTGAARNLLDDADAATMRTTLGITAYDQETVEDFVGGMVSSNTETGVTVTYDDGTGKLNFDAQTAGDARYVMLTTDQTVAGIKTFSDNLLVTRNLTGSQGIVVTNTASGGHARVYLNSDLADAFMLMGVSSGTTFWATGIDNSDSDKYKVSLGTNLGTDDFLAINTNGRIDVHNIIRAMSSSGLRFEDDGGNLGVYVADGGNIGINQASPQWATHITGTSAGAKLVLLTLHNNSNDNNTESAIRFVNRNTSITGETFRVGELSVVGAGGDGIARMIGRVSNGSSLTTVWQADNLVYYHATPVGILATDPQSPLTVVSTDSTLSQNANQIELRSQRNTINALGEGLVGGISFRSDDTSLTAPGAIVAMLQAIATETHTSSALGTALRVLGTLDGATSVNEWARFTDGFMGIGKTAPLGVLDVYDGTAGTVFVTRTGVVGSEVEVLPAGSVPTGVYLRTLGISAAGDVDVGGVYMVTPGAGSTTYPVPTGFLTYKLYSTGRLMVYRTSGASTWEVCADIMYM